MKALLLMIVFFYGCEKHKTEKIKDNLEQIPRNERSPDTPDNDVADNDEEEIPSERPHPVPAPTPLPTPTPTTPAPEPIPACRDYCAESHNFFKHDESGYSYLAFANFGYRGIGRCRGHALTTQKFSFLAKFDQAQPRCDVNDTNCWLGVKAGIDKIMSFKFHRFAGYSDLYEFSQVPRIQRYLRSYVRGVSHRYSAGSANMQVNDRSTRELNTFYELKRRVKAGQLPYVGVRGKLTGSHALLVYDVSFINGQEALCARDPNVVLGRAENCDHVIFIQDDKIYYQRQDRQADYLSFFSLTSDEDQRSQRYKGALRKQCLFESARNGLCK